MHIPDGYLSPQTWIPAYVTMLPFWMVALAKVQRSLRMRQVPLLAMGAAFVFVIMMFNVPIPGGTPGHAAGAVLIAILLGPWAAVIAVTLALTLQALIFGDGGITALGANCLNLAVVMPFVGWGVYKLIAGNAPADSKRHVIGAAVGGYIGLNAAAITTAVMFGIQPLIAHDDAGRALYNLIGLHVAIPAMAIGHLLVFGVVEAVVTGLVIAYLQRTDPTLLPAAPPARGRPASPFTMRRLAIGLGILVLLSPLGIYLPAKFGAGAAWGEWSTEEVQQLVGYVPHQLERLSTAWHAPLPDYSAPGQQTTPLPVLSGWYIFSGALGVALCCGLILMLRKRLARKETDDVASGVDAPAHPTC